MIHTEPTSIPEVLQIFPDVFPDERGEFLESYNQQAFAEAGITDVFVQDNLSTSKQDVVRGLHFQKPPYEQAKLVSVIEGQVLDVVVDIRTDSPTYSKWVSVILDSQKHNMLYIPKGFAHGFHVLSPTAKFFYKCSNYYNKEASSGILWNDPTIGVDWQLTGTAIISTADQTLPTFER